jgi:hypothetical protein
MLAKEEIDSSAECQYCIWTSALRNVRTNYLLLPKPCILKLPSALINLRASIRSVHHFAIAYFLLNMLPLFTPLVASLLLLPYASAYVGGATISSTVLVIARDATSAENSVAAGLRGYGIPFEIVIVPQAGISSLPVLNSSATTANYGGIVTVSELVYNYDGLYNSALSQSQWEELFSYQTNFGVRMARLDVFPTADFGVYPLASNVNDEPIIFTNTSGFSSAGLKT